MIWFYTLLSVCLVSLVSLLGIAVLSLFQAKRLHAMMFVLVSLAVGGLFGDTFLHLLPEAYADAPDRLTPSLGVLSGILAFFVLEKFLRWRHEHTLVDEGDTFIHPVGYINLVADGVHNAIDGMIIASSYLVSVPLGVTTTFAVLLHEIPQEIGDFGVLLHAGFSKKKAVVLNFCSALLCVLGAIVTLLLGRQLTHLETWMVPLTAGGFIYMAGSDLLPELHKDSRPLQSFIQLLAVGFGVGVMLLFKIVFE